MASVRASLAEMLNSFTRTHCSYIVVDFEATCDEPFNPEPQEIIEFPAVVVRSDGTIGDVFHTFVRPVVHPQLSAFCTQLTGITQEHVATAIPFTAALASFEIWLGTHVSGPWRLATCGNWDFGRLFPHQCASVGVVVPDWATRWFNVKTAFRARHLNLPRMLEVLNLPFVGRWHSGLDDTHNIARIVQELLRRRGVFDQQKPWTCGNCDGRNAATETDCQQCARPREMWYE